MSRLHEIWQVSKKPFLNRPLEGADEGLFANRTEKLEDLADLERDGLLCLYGPQGVGKTSFYRRFIDLRAAQNGKRCDYLNIEIVPQKTRILLQILKTVLEAVRDNQLHVRSKASLQVDQKLDRIGQIISVTENIQAEASEPGWFKQLFAGIGVKASKGNSRQFNPIDNESAADELRVIFKSLKKDAFLIVDNTEKLADFYGKDIGNYVEAVSQLSHLLTTTVESNRVSLALSVDERFVTHVRDSSPDHAQVTSHGFCHFFDVDPMDLDGTRDLITRRLSDAKFPGGLDDFIEPSALEQLQSLGDGFPRATVLTLDHAMMIGSKQGKNHITTALVYAGYQKLRESGQVSLRKQSEHISESDRLIIAFLESKGPHAASDPGFQQEVGLKTSQLSERLKRLVDLGLIRSRRTAGRMLYAIEFQDVVEVPDLGTQAILVYLKEQGSRSVSDEDFQQAVGLKSSQLSTRLKSLESAGWVSSRKEGRKRLYFINPGKSSI